MNQEIEGRRVKVLPLLYQRCDLPWFLKGKRYADFTEEELYSDSFVEILDRLGITSREAILVFDVGGGTTDLTMVRVKDEYKGKVDIRALKKDLQSISMRHERLIRKRDTHRKKKDRYRFGK